MTLCCYAGLASMSVGQGAQIATRRILSSLDPPEAG